MVTELPVTAKVAARALEIRRSLATRIPTVDLFIAATASVSGLPLVHRDSHFQSISSKLLHQQPLG